MKIIVHVFNNEYFIVFGTVNDNILNNSKTYAHTSIAYVQRQM